MQNFRDIEVPFNRQRRHVFRCMAGAAGLFLLKNGPVMGQSAPAQASAAALREKLENQLQDIVNDEQKFASAGGQSERIAFPRPLSIDELTAGMPKRLPPSSTQVSEQAIKMIVQLEVSGEVPYTKKYQIPIWPKLESGVTIGIGYDIGQVSKTFFKEDWKDIIPDDIIDRLSAACGKTKQAAKDLASTLNDIKIDWQTANNQFLKRTLPLYIAEVEGSLPNTNLLTSDSLGAITSLVYNRGEHFSSQGDRFEECRNIKALMAAKDFGKIPDEFRAMKRIWEGDPDAKGVVARRDTEAVLFELGLASV